MALAKAFGCEAASVDDPQALDAQLRRAVSREVPTVIEVREADWFARVPS
jgi:acetolactate synthase-1/2/3 large subunit